MSAFADLLTEARDLVRTNTRSEIRLHFDWDPAAGGESWSCWADNIYIPSRDVLGQPSAVFRGSSGEEALRRLVESMR